MSKRSLQLAVGTPPSTPRKKAKWTKRSSVSGLKANQLQMLRQPGGEVKVIDHTVVSPVQNTGVVVSMLPGFTQGPNYYNNYLGRKLTPVGLDIRFHLVGPAGAVLFPDYFDDVRFIVFQWMDDTVPVSVDVLQTINNVSPINITNYNNINVLLDEQFPLWPTAVLTSNTAYNSYAGRRYVKGRKMVPVEMANSTTTGATVGFKNGGIYWLLVGGSTSVPHPSMNVYARLSFEDS